MDSNFPFLCGYKIERPSTSGSVAYQPEQASLFPAQEAGGLGGETSEFSASGAFTSDPRVRQGGAFSTFYMGMGFSDEALRVGLYRSARVYTHFAVSGFFPTRTLAG